MFRKGLYFLWYSVSYKPLRKLPNVIAKAIFLFFVLIFIHSSAQAQNWDTIPLPNQTILLKEDEMVMDNQKIKTIHCRSNLPAQDIRNFYLRFLPGLGWNEDCPECNQQGNDNARLTFTRGDNKISIIIIPSPLGKKGENDVIIAMSKLKEEAQQGEEYQEPEGKDLSFIPRYPQSRRISSLEYNASQKAMLTYSSMDDVNKILDFYRQNMAEYDWNLADETNFQALPPELGEMQSQIKLRGSALIFKSPRGECIISVFEHPQEGENSRIIGIKYNEK